MSFREYNVKEAMSTIFGYKDFKNDVQRAAIMAICRGAQEVVISMPPGFGRTLCFQLPVLTQMNKTAVVFSAKLSFIKKQINFLKTKHIRADVLFKNMLLRARNNILEDLTSSSPTIKLLYATPQMAKLTYFKVLIQLLKERNLLSYFVFDEAHCLSTYGYEYTPLYTQINLSDKLYKYTPIIAVTTTVTSEVISDISNQLKLLKPSVYEFPVEKLNVQYDVWFLDIIIQPYNHLKNYIVQVLGSLDSSSQKEPEGLVIVYCREIKTAYKLKETLDSLGIPTVVYLHRLNEVKRTINERKWLSGKAHVLIATYDTGFIHSKPVGVIIHWSVPENISKYYRECAQANMKSGPTFCRIYFSIAEHIAVEQMIKNHKVMNDVGHISRRLREYHRMVSFCVTPECRHVMISNYFGRVIERCKTHCDFCIDKDIVRTRTNKFIWYSCEVEAIEYNTWNIIKDGAEETESEAQVNGESIYSIEKKHESTAQVENSNKNSIKQFDDLSTRQKQICSITEICSPATQSANDGLTTNTNYTVNCSENNSGVRPNELDPTCFLPNKCIAQIQNSNQNSVKQFDDHSTRRKEIRSVTEIRSPATQSANYGLTANTNDTVNCSENTSGARANELDPTCSLPNKSNVRKESNVSSEKTDTHPILIDITNTESSNRESETEDSSNSIEIEIYNWGYSVSKQRSRDVGKELTTSLRPSSSKQNICTSSAATKITNIEAKKSVLITEVLTDSDEAEDGVSTKESSDIIFIGISRAGKLMKRSLPVDTQPKNFTPKRRKVAHVSPMRVEPTHNSVATQGIGEHPTIEHSMNLPIDQLNAQLNRLGVTIEVLRNGVRRNV